MVSDVVVGDNALELQPALNVCCIDDLHVVDGGARHVAEVVKEGHRSPAELMLDFNVLCASTV